MTTDDGRLQSVCPVCGDVFDRYDRIGACINCQPARRGNTARPTGKTAARGYDHHWRKLSERARRLQQFCDDCGSTADLTADHSPEAWARRSAGRVIRLADIAVVCRRCNSERGAARGSSTTDRHQPGLAGPTENPNDPTR